MGYSIFQKTMVDMTYTEIEESIRKGACAILPVSVVEEHGPHLCTGTDIYLTQNVCERIKMNLEEKGKSVLIAPPFYWGINSITNGFAGSFSISVELMQNLLLEILTNLHRWGIKKIFMLNFHGDFVHILKLAEVAKRASQELGMNVSFAGDKSLFLQLGLPSGAAYLTPVVLDKIPGRKDYPDIHAGAVETSWMLLNYGDLVHTGVARQQKATSLSVPEIKMWLQGGDTARKLTPFGFLGNPADIELDETENMEKEIVEAFSQSIAAAMTASE